MAVPIESTTNEARRRLHRRRIRIAVLAVATTILFALLFALAAFNTLEWLRPSSVGETLGLYALSTINFLAFVVLLMVLGRNIIKLRRERLQRKLGSRFQTRMVFFFAALSLLPVLFLFFATTGFINRSLDKWFSLPGNEMLTNAWQIHNGYIASETEGLQRTAVTLARRTADSEPAEFAQVLAEEVATQQLIFAKLYDRDGNLMAEQFDAQARTRHDKQMNETLELARGGSVAGEPFSARIDDEGRKTISLLAAASVETGGALVIAREIPRDLVGSISRIQEFRSYYDSLQQNRQWLRGTLLQALALITLLVLFIAFWLALYVARSLTDPVQRLVQATERIKGGDLAHRAEIIGDDELALLATSFNEMTADLGENRQRLEASAAELQASNAALDERRRYIEAILQSLSAGVISLDEDGQVTTINEAARELLKLDQEPLTGAALESLLPEAQREELRRMILRAARARSVTREVQFTLANQTELTAAVTVAALHDPAGQSRGAVIVIEDLTDLIDAQRRAAWSEVARRMAHEIKNPLTPIRLSAERLAKNLIEARNGSGPLGEKQTKLIRECTTLIGDEVGTLQRMVDEFSNFARLPGARLAAASLNEVVETTLKLYADRLDGITLESDLAPVLLPVLLDAEQIKRALVNLIDNAAQALSNAPDPHLEKRITVSTRELAARGTIELAVADTGPGILPADVERVFDPYFSTHKRGTGLGLAIVSRIVAEHQGRIRVQPNRPRGARFTIELPATKENESR